MKRTLPALLVAVSAAAMGGPAIVAQTSTSPATVNVIRNQNLSQDVWPGDFNGDGITDLAGSDNLTSDGGTGRVQVVIGNGGAGFSTPIVNTFVGHVLGVGDFNGDGRVDLIVGNDARNDTEILPGNGDGSFGAGRPVSSLSYVMFAVSGDLDGDGHRDLVVGGEGGIDVLPGHGDFTFGTPVNLTPGLSPHDAILADLNGDGRKDLVVANHYAYNVSVFLNKGAFLFSAADVATGGNTNDVTAADLNGDGKLDLVVATTNGGDVDNYFDEGHAEVLVGNGDGTFATPVRYATPMGAWQVVVGDFTRDGKVDIATANRSSIYRDDCTYSYKTWDSLTVLAGDGTGTFGAAQSFSIGNQASEPGDRRFQNTVRTLNTSDVNRDGATDLIASWGAIFLNVVADPNWAPTANAGPDITLQNTSEGILWAKATDDDQDMLAWRWTDEAGNPISDNPSACLSGLTAGTHVFTITVDDGHGHTASDSVNVTVTSSSGTTSISITAPVAGEIVPAGTPYTIRFHVDDTAMQMYEHTVFYSVDNGSTWDYIWECHYVPDETRPGDPTSRDETCVWQNPGPPTKQAKILVWGQDGDDQPIATAQSGVFVIQAEPGAVPNPWKHQDIGSVAVAGTATYDAGVFSVEASGADIWGTADEFHYVYQLDPGYVSTNGANPWSITTYIESVENVAAWTKAGVMIREGLDPSARHASLFVTPGKGIAFQRRTATGGTSVNTSGPLLTAPVWLKLGVNGTTITAYYRKRTTDLWTVLGQQTFTSFSTVAAGLALTSHQDGTLASATFSNVDVMTMPTLQSVDVGTTGGSTTTDGVISSLTSKGADIWGTSDQFRFHHTYWGTIDGTIIARVRSVQNVSPWTKAGVMFREASTTGTVDPSAKYVFVMVTPGKGIAMQYRSATGGSAASVSTPISGTAPGWVRLTKSGDTFVGYWSTDGANWTAIGTIGVAMDYVRLEGGLALTSHNTSTSATASFDDVLFKMQ